MGQSYVKLNDSFDNIPQFIEGLFEGGVRSTSGVTSSIRDGHHYHPFVDSESRGYILKSWLAAWQHGEGDDYDHHFYKRCPETDKHVLEFLAGWLKDNEIYKYKPQIEYLKTNGDGRPVYRNHGYDRIPFLDPDGNFYYGSFDDHGKPENAHHEKHTTVADFLHNLFYGAHFLAVCSDQDGGGSQVSDLWLDFQDQFDEDDRGNDWANSHYVTVWLDHEVDVNKTGWYWLNISGNEEPSSHPLITALLFGETAHSDSNTFMQLEGWPSQFPTGDNEWHMADFEAHKETLWNFSTFGACAYSEKRCTPIFLAGKDFDISLDSETKMPLFVGAGSEQGWMKTDLLEI